MTEYTFTDTWYRDIPSRLDITQFFLVRHFSGGYHLSAHKRKKVGPTWEEISDCIHSRLTYREISDLLVELARYNPMSTVVITNDHEKVYVMQSVDCDDMVKLRLIME